MEIFSCFFTNLGDYGVVAHNGGMFGRVEQFIMFSSRNIGENYA